MSENSWSSKELDLINKFFNTQMTLLTLYTNIKQINPSRTYDALGSKVRRMERNQGWKKPRVYAIDSMRVGYLDIEASNLNADFGYILTWYIKPEASRDYDFSIIKRDEILNYEFDKRIVKELLEAFSKYDILYTHYGADGRFDIPFIRTRAYRHNLQNMLPDYMDKFILDTWEIARKKLRLHSNRLDSVADAVGVKGVKKTSLQPHIWQKAAVGDTDSLEYIRKHNLHDVILLERVHRQLKKVERPVYRSM